MSSTASSVPCEPESIGRLFSARYCRLLKFGDSSNLLSLSQRTTCSRAMQTLQWDWGREGGGTSWRQVSQTFFIIERLQVLAASIFHRRYFCWLDKNCTHCVRSPEHQHKLLPGTIFLGDERMGFIGSASRILTSQSGQYSLERTLSSPLNCIF